MHEINATSGHVILLHGLWMRAFTLVALRRRLERAGFSVELYDYASVLRGPDATAENLLRRAATARREHIHFVGHSLGGLIALHALRRQPDICGGRVVCIGTPLRGSAVARRIARMPGGATVIGKSLAILSSGLDRWDGCQQVGSVAGRLPIGLGYAFPGLALPHDGTVSVAETEVDGLSDHCIVPATHTGLVFSADAAAQTIAFLAEGSFKH